MTMTDPTIIPASETEAHALDLTDQHGQAALDALSQAAKELAIAPSTPATRAARSHLRQAQAAVVKLLTVAATSNHLLKEE